MFLIKGKPPGYLFLQPSRRLSAVFYRTSGFGRMVSIWLLIPAALSLAVFSWLLTLHPAASGRVYAAYGGVYVATALVWLKVVDGEDLSIFDWTGAGIALLGMGVIVFGWSAKA